jgi:RND family efflux transporter MFP subunit
MSTLLPIPAPPAPSQDAPPRPAPGWVVALIAAGLVVALAAIFLLSYLPRRRHQEQLAADTQQRALAPPLVQVATPTLAPPEAPLWLPGSVEAGRVTTIYARTSGYVRRWLVDLGDPVRAGQLMAEIDAPEVDQELLMAKATLGEAVAAVAQAEAAQVLARLSYQRYRQLGPAIATQQDIDQRQADLQSADANLQAARAKVAADTADVHRLEQLVGFGSITAPFSGVVTLRSIEIGDLVNAGASGSVAQSLFSFAQTDPVRVVVQVPQAYAASIALGQSVHIIQRGSSDHEAIGHVAHLAHAMDPTARTMRVEVLTPNPDNQIMPGMYAQAVFTLPTTRRRLQIGASALLFTGAGTRVAVVDAEHRIRFHPIVIAVDNGDTLQLDSGLSLQDRVVMNPGGRLDEGTLVDIAAPAAEAAAPGPAPGASGASAR